MPCTVNKHALARGPVNCLCIYDRSKGERQDPCERKEKSCSIPRADIIHPFLADLIKVGGGARLPVPLNLVTCLESSLPPPRRTAPQTAEPPPRKSAFGRIRIRASFTTLFLRASARSSHASRCCPYQRPWLTGPSLPLVVPARKRSARHDDSFLHVAIARRNASRQRARSTSPAQYVTARHEQHTSAKAYKPPTDRETQ